MIGILNVGHIDQITLMASEKTGIVQFLFDLPELFIHRIGPAPFSMEEAPGIPAFHIQDLMIRDPCHDTAALDLIGVDIASRQHPVHHHTKLLIAVRLEQIPSRLNLIAVNREIRCGRQKDNFPGIVQPS